MQPVLFVLLTLAASTTGCLVRGAEQTLEERLATRLGPADHYAVKIRGTTNADLARGFIREMRIEAVGLRRDDAPAVSILECVLRDVRGNPATETLRAIGHASIDLTLTDAAITAWLRHRYKQLETIQVFFLYDKVLVKMDDFPLTGEPLRGTARVIVRGKSVELQPVDVFLSGRAMDAGMLEYLMSEVNPVLDLSKWPAEITLESVSCSPGRLKARGSVRSVDVRRLPDKVPPIR